jgi:hypothetical protein
MHRFRSMERKDNQENSRIMGNFSTTPSDALKAALDNGYTRVHIEQGVPLLDRDLNLLGDLPVSMLESLVGNFVGDGFSESDDAFKITSVPGAVNDFRIGGPGVCLVNGVQVRTVASTLYSEQLPQPPELRPPNPRVRVDAVYLDVDMAPEITDTQDPLLANPGDVRMRTSVRQGYRWTVRVAEGRPSPPSPSDTTHVHVPLALLVRGASDPAITDIRDLRDSKIVPRLERLGPLVTSVENPETGLAALGTRSSTLEAKVAELEARLTATPALIDVPELDSGGMITGGTDFFPAILTRTLSLPPHTRWVFLSGSIRSNDFTTLTSDSIAVSGVAPNGFNETVLRATLLGHEQRVSLDWNEGSNAELRLHPLGGANVRTQVKLVCLAIP